MMGVLVKSRRQIYYSQFGEDVSIQALTSKTAKGFYVDVGAHHPKLWSNTYALHQKGWSGVNIDLHQHNIELFNLFRRRATNVCAAVSDGQAELPLYEFGSVSLFNTLSKQDAEQVWRGRGIPYTTRMVKTQTLTTILAEHGHANQKIDLLSIDVEGHDLAVLRSLDFSVYQPTIICVELHERDIKKVIESPLFTFLTAQRYVLASWPSPSLIFTR
jgi:FkbM family methyltransferase